MPNDTFKQYPADGILQDIGLSRTEGPVYAQIQIFHSVFSVQQILMKCVTKEGS